MTHINSIIKNLEDGIEIRDSAGNIVDTHIDADGGYHLGTAFIQSIYTSTNNSTTANLASGATFTGSADETFGINGIQVFHASNENCTIYIDQSINNNFPAATTITDSFVCLADSPCSRTFISVSPYYRMRVTNNGSSTTTSLASYTGMTPVINPLPRSLTEDGRLMTETTITGRHNSDRHAWINPTNEQAVSPVYRMVGTNFDGDTKDTNFWTDGSLLSGSVTQAGGEIDLHTNELGAQASSSAKYTSVRKGRFVAGSAMLIEGGLNFKTAYTANNIRRFGAYTTTDIVNTPVDGFYFELDNTTFSVNSRANSGSVSSVSSSGFNGALGTTWAPTADTYYKFSIEYSPLAAFYYVNGELLHKKVGAHQSNYITLPITIENINTAGSTDVSFETVGMYIARQGELSTNQTSKFMQNQGTTICKLGAGVIKGIVVSSWSDNTVISFYDGLTTDDTLIWTSGQIKAKTDYAPLSINLFGLTFSNALTIAITGADSDVLAIYE